MFAKHKIIIAIFLIVCLAFLSFAIRKTSELTRTERFFVFNTPCSVTIWGENDKQWDGALHDAISELQSLNDCINAYDSSSELSRLNASAYQNDFTCSDKLWRILLASRQAWQDTNGAFDPTVGPLMRLWGFHAKRDTVPGQDEIDAALALVGMDKVTLEENAKSVRFDKAGMSLDFGGIAKGYACDILAGIFSKYGIDVYMIDLGGNIMVSKKAPGGREDFSIGIRDPMRNGGVIRTLRIIGKAVATSGNYERSRVIDGKRIGHIMDPRTGRPGEFRAGVSAVTVRGVDSDAFSTAVFVRGEELAKELIAKHDGTSFIIVDENGKEILLP